MQEGVYRVTFQGPTSQDEGTLAVHDGGLKGRDSSFVYEGRYETSRDQFCGELWFSKHTEGQSVFGPLRDFRLLLEGNVAPDQLTFSATGSVILNLRTDRQPALTNIFG
jgi:hypothetical protein